MRRASAWVGCWACYSEAALVGAWFNLYQGAPTIEDVHRLGMDPHDLRDVSGHEELGAFDLGGDLRAFADAIGESLTATAAVAEALVGLDADHLAAFAAFTADVREPCDAHLVQVFGDAYIGQFDSLSAFGAEFGGELIGWSELPDHLREFMDCYVPWEEVGKDLLLGDYDAALVNQTLYVWESD